MSNLIRTQQPISTSSAAGRQPVVDTVPASGDKYTVLLLDEAQLDKFLRKGHGGSPRSIPRTVDVWPGVGRQPKWIAAAVALSVAASAAVWIRASADNVAAAGDAVAQSSSVDRPPLATGASFNVTVTSFARDDGARSLAMRLFRAGLPAYDWRVGGSQRQVLLGPFVSIDEAEQAQRAVRSEGFRATRLYVDERLRTLATGSDDFRTPRAVRTALATDPPMVLVAAPGRLSLALELREEPREVSGRRLSPDTYEVVIRQPSSALTKPADARVWSAPADAGLLHDVSLQEVSPGNSQNLRLRLNLPENVDALVRTSGHRLYVDMSRAADEESDAAADQMQARVAAALKSAGGDAHGDATPGLSSSALSPQAARPTVPSSPTPAVVAGGPVANAPASATAVAASGADLSAVYARFEAMQPFLRSAVASPDPTVLAALRGSLSELEQTLHALPASKQAPSYGLVTSAVQLAKEAVARDFIGDRVAQVREASAQFTAARQRRQ